MVGRAREPRGLLRRRSRNLPQRRTVLIVCEGKETEPNYFHCLKCEPGPSKTFAITIKPGRGRSPLSVVNEAVKLKKEKTGLGIPYDEVWAVFDTEGPESRDSLLKALKKAKKEAIETAISNPCFEVWLLSHFEKSASAFASPEQAEKRLNVIWKKAFGGQEYDKSASDIFQKVSGNTETAIENSRSVREGHHQAVSIEDANSATDVYMLVEKLLSS